MLQGEEVKKLDVLANDLFINININIKSTYSSIYYICCRGRR